MPSYIDEAERALSRCRKVKTGDIIMPDDVNCLADGAVYSIDALKHIVNEIAAKSAEVDVIDYMLRRYRPYHYDNAGALVWFEPFDLPFGLLLLDGGEADTVEIELPHVGGGLCWPDVYFGRFLFIGRKGGKPIIYWTRYSRSIRVSNPDLIVIVKDSSSVRTGAGIDDVVRVPDAIRVKLYKGGSVTKSYSIDVIGMRCGGYDCYDIDNWFSHFDIFPTMPERWYFAEVVDRQFQYGPTCLCAFDSTDEDTAEVLGCNCDRDGIPYIYVPPGTVMLRYQLVNFGMIAQDFTSIYTYPAALPDPKSRPNVESDSILCG